MNSKPLVSSVIIFLNAEKFIEEAIESVFAQTYDNWELLLVDDGSTDGSTQIARRYAEQYPEKVHYLEHLEHQNRGMGASRNLGVSQAKGEYIALLDSDDVWLPHKLQQQVEILNSHPEAGMVYGLSQAWHGWTGKPEDIRCDAVPELGVQGDRLYEPPALMTLLYPLRKASAPCPSDLLLRREMVERVGGFEEGFTGMNHMYEDQAFLAKVYLKETVFVANELWDRYREHPDSCVSVTERAGQYHSVRLFFFNWLAEYLYKQGIKDIEVWKLLQEAQFRTHREQLKARNERLRELKGALENERRKVQQLRERNRRLAPGAQNQKQQISVTEIARGIKAFLKKASLKPEASLTRDSLPSEDSQLLHAQDDDVKSGNLVWIFGTARVGSTWLAAMMADLKGHEHWSEPLVGELFGSFFHNLGLRRNEWTPTYAYNDFIFSSSYKKTWLESMRSVVLEGARARFPKMTQKEYLIVQEPNGSLGAPWLSEALPESRMILLIRDPRDIVASVLDGFKKGGWIYAEEYLIDYEGERRWEWPDSPADTNPNAFVEAQANRYVRDIGYAKQAYDLHGGRKVLVRYEDLRADTLGAMKHIYSALEIAVDEEELARVVDKHSWESIPEDKKGKGKVLRKATPGGWREDLTPEQAEVVERITAPLLREFYSK